MNKTLFVNRPVDGKEILNILTNVLNAAPFMGKYHDDDFIALNLKVIEIEYLAEALRDVL